MVSTFFRKSCSWRCYYFSASGPFLSVNKSGQVPRSQHHNSKNFHIKKTKICPKVIIGSIKTFLGGERQRSSPEPFGGTRNFLAGQNLPNQPAIICRTDTTSKQLELSVVCGTRQMYNPLIQFSSSNQCQKLVSGHLQGLDLIANDPYKI